MGRCHGRRVDGWFQSLFEEMTKRPETGSGSGSGGGVEVEMEVVAEEVEVERQLPKGVEIFLVVGGRGGSLRSDEGVQRCPGKEDVEGSCTMTR